MHLFHSWKCLLLTTLCQDLRHVPRTQMSNACCHGAHSLVEEVTLQERALNICPKYQPEVSSNLLNYCPCCSETNEVITNLTFPSPLSDPSYQSLFYKWAINYWCWNLKKKTLIKSYEIPMDKSTKEMKDPHMDNCETTLGEIKDNLNKRK